MLIDRVEMHLGRFELLIKTEIPSGYVGAGDLRIHRHAIKVVGGNEAVGGNAPEASAKSIAAAADAIPQVLVSTEEGRFPELAKPEHVKLALNTDLEVVAVVLGRALVIEDASIHGVRVVLLGSAVFTVEEQAGRHVLDGERSGPLLDVALEEGLVARGRREGSAGQRRRRLECARHGNPRRRSRRRPSRSSIPWATCSGRWRSKYRPRNSPRQR